MKKRVLFALLIVIAITLTPVSNAIGLSPQQIYTPRKLGKLALVIMLDGLDYKIYEELDLSNLKELASLGFEYYSKSILPSSTTAGSTAIATGAFPNASGVVHTYAYNSEEYHSQLPDEEPMRYYFEDMLNATTVFETLFTAGVHTYLITAKSKLEVMLGKSGSVEGFIYLDWRDYFTIDPHEQGVGLDDRKEMMKAMTDISLEYLERAIQYIEGGEDVFMFIAYPEPDWAGHAFGPESTVYKGIVKYLDGEVGRIIDYINETGLWDNSLIIVTADHGYVQVDPIKNVIDPNDPKHVPGLTVQHVISPTAGTALFLYVKNLEDIDEAVNQLRSYPWVAGLWTRVPVEGANGTLEDIGLNNIYAGDIFIDIRAPYYASVYVNGGAHGGTSARDIPVIVSGGALLKTIKPKEFTQLHVATALSKFFGTPLPNKCFYTSIDLEFKPTATIEALVSPRIAEPNQEIEVKVNYSIEGDATGVKLIIDVVDQNSTLILTVEESLETLDGSATKTITISNEGIMQLYIYVVDENNRVLGGVRVQLLVVQIERPPRNWGAIFGGIALSIILIIVMFIPFIYKRFLRKTGS